jgi:hypothetical protein
MVTQHRLPGIGDVDLARGWIAHGPHDRFGTSCGQREQPPTGEDSTAEKQGTLHRSGILRQKVPPTTQS